MKIFFDEDTGTSVPKAVRLVGLREIEYVSNEPNRRIKKGTLDEDWIRFAGRNGYLIFSCDRRILRTAGQRQLLITEGVGAVFLTTGQARAWEVLRLVLDRWMWLEAIDASQPRPFAYEITITGRARSVSL